eukprot:2017310-Pleurochrysis_carterae.AAC.1
MANATGLPRLHSVARCLCAAHAPAFTQAPRGSALKPLPRPRPLRSRLHTLACFPFRAARPANRGVHASKG